MLPLILSSKQKTPKYNRTFIGDYDVKLELTPSQFKKNKSQLIVLTRSRITATQIDPTSDEQGDR